MSDTIKVFGIWIAITAVLFAVLTGIHAWLHFSNYNSELNILKIQADDFESRLRKAEEKGELKVNKHVEQMSHPQLRVKGEELRRLYNRRQEIIKIITERSQTLAKKGQLSEETIKMINTELDLLAKENQRIKLHYMKVVAYAESEAVDRMHDANKQESEAESLLRDYEDIINSINTPKSFR